MTPYNNRHTVQRLVTFVDCFAFTLAKLDLNGNPANLQLKYRNSAIHMTGTTKFAVAMKFRIQSKLFNVFQLLTNRRNNANCTTKNKGMMNKNPLNHFCLNLASKCKCSRQHMNVSASSNTFKAYVETTITSGKINVRTKAL